MLPGPHRVGFQVARYEGSKPLIIDLELLQHRLFRDLAKAQRHFDTWRRVYNQGHLYLGAFSRDYPNWVSTAAWISSTINCTLRRP